MKPRIPSFDSDEAAQHFVDTANLADYDLSGGTPIQFEFETKAAHLNMRIPQPLLDAVKARAKAQGIPYARFIRRLLEQAVNQPR
jgi:predicted DNA binding CopG/RHH family protein